MKYYVEVIEDATNEVVKRIDCGSSERKAERVEDGIAINLDWERFTTRIVKENK